MISLEGAERTWQYAWMCKRTTWNWQNIAVYVRLKYELI